MLNRKKPQVDSVDTVIGADTSMEGKLHSKTSLRVEGTYHGEVDIEGDVTIGKDGILTYSVKARTITIAGKLEGDIQASDKVHILSSGHFKGKASMGSIVIEEGATFEGESTMTSSNIEKLDSGQEKEQDLVANKG